MCGRSVSEPPRLPIASKNNELPLHLVGQCIELFGTQTEIHELCQIFGQIVETKIIEWNEFSRIKMGLQTFWQFLNDIIRRCDVRGMHNVGELDGSDSLFRREYIVIKML